MKEQEPETIQSLCDGQIDLADVKKLQLVLRAINHKKIRTRIMKFLEKGEQRVTEIHRSLDCEQSVASQHLAILRRAKLVKTRHEGKNIFYRVDHKTILQLSKILEDMFPNKKSQEKS